jgi:hypothetical protein
VPAIAAAFEQTLCCARCRQALSRLPTDPKSATDRPTAAPTPTESADSNPQIDDLELLSAEQQAELDNILSRAEWLLGLDAPAVKPYGPTRAAGFHPPHESLRGHHLTLRKGNTNVQRASRITMVSWCALAVALTGFFCGGMLLAWSLLSNRPELWNVGETVTLASQVGLLVGLILQLERLGHDRHQTASRLTILDERVESLRSTARWSGNLALRGDPRTAAPSESLLADLKSQLDELTSTLGGKRTA